MSEPKITAIEYRHIADLTSPECEFCGEEFTATIHLYLCRERNTENYRDYTILAHRVCFDRYITATFDKSTVMRGV